MIQSSTKSINRDFNWPERKAYLIPFSLMSVLMPLSEKVSLQMEMFVFTV